MNMGIHIDFCENVYLKKISFWFFFEYPEIYF